ncbi:hypothetical protein PFISCL1PPCAC_23023, partial [Pristionchus fissidentatus]
SFSSLYSFTILNGVLSPFSARRLSDVQKSSVSTTLNVQSSLIELLFSIVWASSSLIGPLKAPLPSL